MSVEGKLSEAGPLVWISFPVNYPQVQASLMVRPASLLASVTVKLPTPTIGLDGKVAKGPAGTSVITQIQVVWIQVKDRCK